MTELPIRGRRLLFVGGKGGVGKTTTAAAIAMRFAQEGSSSLVVSTDPAHSLGDLFDRSIGDRKTELLPLVWGLEIEPEREVDRYLDSVTATMRDFVHPAMYPEIERQMELTRHSPGAEEAALMERLAHLMGESDSDYDRVIFDTAPTGHTLRLLALPEIMSAWMDGLLRSRERSDSFGRAAQRLSRRAEGGEAATESEDAGGAGRHSDELSWFQESDDAPPDERGRRIREVLLARRRAFAQARRLLLDRSRTAFVMVLIPEKLPILETEKALEALARHRVPVGGLIVNRVLPDGYLGDFLELRRAQEQEYLSRIDRLFGNYPRVRVPLLQSDVEGTDSLESVAAHLAIAKEAK